MLCAVSGGADSMCLLSMLLESRRELDISVVCAHFNHRLRGEESDRDENFVKGFCKERGVSFFSGSGDVLAYAGENGLGTEEAARTLRYAFLRETAEKTGAAYIATAHTADDNAETVLINLARGTGLKGLCGIPPVRDNIVRPIIGMTREQVEEYLIKQGVHHVEDSTNAGDEYTRNRIRHRVTPVLREINPAFAENVLRACELLRRDEQLLDGIAERFVSENLKDSGLSSTALEKLPQAVFARVMRMMCPRPLTGGHVEMLSRLCGSDKAHGFADVPGIRVTKEYDRIVFSEIDKAEIEPVRLAPGETVVIRQSGIRISCSMPRVVNEVYTSLTTFFFKCENICDSIIVKSRADGDRIRIKGRNCTKSLKKLFSEAKLPPAQRELVPVLYDGRGVLAVYGFGCDERCAASPGDLAIEIKIEKI